MFDGDDNRQEDDGGGHNPDRSWRLERIRQPHLGLLLTIPVPDAPGKSIARLKHCVNIAHPVEVL